MVVEHEGATSLKHTALFETHKASGAKLVDFAGWEMPIQYEGIIAEHNAVRQSVGLFDVSHMGRIEITGQDVVPFIDYLTTNNVKKLEPGQAQYSTMCYYHGTVIDDLLVYRGEESILLIVNAANHPKDLAWIRQHQISFDVDLRDITQDTSLLALQGPTAEVLLSRLTDIDLSKIPYYQFRKGRVAGQEVIISRTGYTGEDGFELLTLADQSAEIWQQLMEAGGKNGIKACGLGSRDTLRLEMGYCLYGHEIDENTSPLEAGLGWIVKFDKGNFIGKSALVAEKERGLSRRLVGIVMQKQGIPRQGFPIIVEGEKRAELVSGGFSPSLKIGIGTGFLPPDLSKVGTEVQIDIRGNLHPAQVTKLPFYIRSQNTVDY